MPKPWIAAPDMTSFWETILAQRPPHDSWDATMFHISDATECSRRLYYRMYDAQHGLPSPPRLADERMTLMLGHGIHAVLQRYINELGLSSEQDTEVRVGDPYAEVTGSVDQVLSSASVQSLAVELGLPLVCKGSHIILDYKSKKEEHSITRGPEGKIVTSNLPGKLFKWPEWGYIVQVQCYMTLLSERYPSRYPDIQVGYNLVVNKNSGKLQALAIERDDSTWAGVRLKAIRIQEALAIETPPPPEYGPLEEHCQGWLTNRVRRYGCPYLRRCHCSSV